MGVRKRVFLPIVLSIIGAASTAAAETDTGPAPDSVRNVFVPIKLVPDHAREYKYFPEVAPKEEKAPELTPPTSPQPTPLTPEALVEKRTVLPGADDIMRTFGDPNQDAPILAIKDAPLPFQGMMQALQIGDEKLAFQYARQYVRHLRNLQDRNQHVQAMMAIAQEKEGVADGKGWTADPSFNQVRETVEKDLKKNLPIEQAGLAKGLDPETRKLVESAARQEGFDLESGEQVTPVRDRLEQALYHKVPRDPQAKVNIHFFFRPKDKESIAMGRLAEKLYQRSLKDPRINFLGLTMESALPSWLENFRKKTGATFPIRNGAVLVKAMKIKSTPTTVFTAASTGDLLVEEGRRELIYLDEIVNLMQGARSK